MYINLNEYRFNDWTQELVVNIRTVWLLGHVQSANSNHACDHPASRFVSVADVACKKKCQDQQAYTRTHTGQVLVTPTKKPDDLYSQWPSICT